MVSEQPKAVVLASGGLDSTVTAAVAKEEGFSLCLLSVGYGQRHKIEITKAQQVADWLQCMAHKILDVDLGSFGGSALTGEGEVPKSRSEETRQHGIPVTYVPARNIIFLSLALSYAEVQGATAIYFGANIRDYSGYPDCRPEFIDAFATMAKVGTKGGVEGKNIEIRAPLLMMTKAQIIQKGTELGVPFALTHSCYDPDLEGVACGQCDSCLIRREGFREAGLDDPIPYNT